MPACATIHRWAVSSRCLRCLAAEPAGPKRGDSWRVATGRARCLTTGRLVPMGGIAILPGANRHKRPLWAEFIFALDSWLRRREGVFEYSHKPDCIFRAQLSRLSSDVLLSDGTFGRPGDRVIDLHLWNEQIPAMPIAGYSLAWGCRFNRSFEKSLGELAQSLV